MSYIGNQKIGSVYVGSQKISAIYKGSTQVYSSVHVPVTITVRGSGWDLSTSDSTLATASTAAQVGDTISTGVQISPNASNPWYASKARFTVSVGDTTTDDHYIDIPAYNGNAWDTNKVTLSFVATTSGTVRVKWESSKNSGVYVQGDVSVGP